MAQRRTRTAGAAPKKLSGPIKPLDLEGYTGPLYVENTMLGVFTCSTEKETITLGPRGAVDAVQALSPDMARSVDFQRAWRKGLLVVTTDTQMEEQLIIASAKQDELNREAAEKLQAQIEATPQDRDLIPVPQPDGTVEFTTKAEQAAAEAGEDEDPRATDPRFVAQVTYDPASGENVTTYVPVTITETMKESTDATA